MAHPDQRAQLVLPARLELRDQAALLERMAQRDHQDQQGQQVLLGQPVLQVLWVRLEQRGQAVSAGLVDHPVSMGHRDLQVHPGQQARPEQPAHRGRQAQVVLWVLPDHLAHRERRV